MTTDNQFLTTREETENWLKAMAIKKYTIHDDLTVDVNGDVYLTNKNLNYIPVQFGYVYGNFSCSQNYLTNLVGYPKTVVGNFSCLWNELISLEGCPDNIKGNFSLYKNPITDFNNFEFNVKGHIILTPTKNMDYLDSYKNSLGNVEINFNEFKKLQSLKNLENKLNEDLSIKSVKIKHKI